MGTRRILIVLLVATLGVTGVMAVWAWTARPANLPPTVSAPPAPTVPTAEEALALAQEAARGWQGDAQLVGVSASWTRARRETLLAGPTGWSFVFYSPAAGEIRYVGVDGGGATLGRQFPAPTPPETLEGWRFPAADALLVFLASGGERYLQERPGAAVHIHLGAESGRAVWTVLAVDGAQEPFILRLDALTGERLP